MSDDSVRAIVVIVIFRVLPRACSVCTEGIHNSARSSRDSPLHDYLSETQGTVDNLYDMSLISKMAIAVQLLVLSALISSGDTITAGELYSAVYTRELFCVYT